jgi:hypothetical protein
VEEDGNLLFVQVGEELVIVRGVQAQVAGAPQRLDVAGERFVAAEREIVGVAPEGRRRGPREPGEAQVTPERGEVRERG